MCLCFFCILKYTIQPCGTPPHKERRFNLGSLAVNVQRKTSRVFLTRHPTGRSFLQVEDKLMARPQDMAALLAPENSLRPYTPSKKESLTGGRNAGPQGSWTCRGKTAKSVHPCLVKESRTAGASLQALFAALRSKHMSL